MAEYPIERLKRLRRRNETWQGGIIRFPRWLAVEGQKPIRPWLAIWVSLEPGRVITGEPRRPDEKSPDMLLEAIESGSGAPGTRPSEIHVADPALADDLRQKLEGLDTQVTLADRLPELEQMVALMRAKADPSGPPSLFSSAGVTLEIARAFYDAARDFYRAAPWQHLTDDDLIRVESPAPPDESLSHLTVLGAAGVRRGIGLFRSPEHHANLQAVTDMRKFYRKHGPIWTVFFTDITQIPFDDADLFEDNDLPLAGDHAYPTAKSYDGAENITRRPDAMTLAYFEGLLRALAQTTEAEMDSGRWTRRVPTSAGEQEFTLALPALLGEMPPKPQLRAGPSPAQMREMERALDRLEKLDLDQEFATPEEAIHYIQNNVKDESEITRAETPLEHAQDLVDQAGEFKGRKSRQLIRKALETYPDCADAYVLLAYREPDLARARELFEQAVAAGERAMGPSAFDDLAGRFWSRVETRAYMRARMGLAECLRALNRSEDAITHFREMIRLNPKDQQGVRQRLLATHLDLKQDDALADLFAQYEQDRSALWLYGKALWRFRREGDTHVSRQAMLDALEANLLVSTYLLKKRDLPAKAPSSFTPGSESEAIVVAMELNNAWNATPGAIYWLTEQRRKKRERDDRRAR